MTLRVVNDSECRQTLLYGLSEQHLKAVADRLNARYKVSITLSEPKVAYRETIRGTADVEYKHKKQSGGHGQYGHVKIKLEPSGDYTTPYIFEESVVGGAVPKNFFPAVEKGIAEGVASGPLAGYPVVGIKVNLYDGSYHSVDSSEAAFKTAAAMALKKGIMEADPVLLEPIAAFEGYRFRCADWRCDGRAEQAPGQNQRHDAGRQRRSAHRRGDPHRDALRLWDGSAVSGPEETVPIPIVPEI